jgi:hypothetical protein
MRVTGAQGVRSEPPRPALFSFATRAEARHIAEA